MLSIVFVRCYDLGFKSYLGVMLCVYAFAALFVYVAVGKLCNGLFILFEKKSIITIFKFCIPIGLATLVGTLNMEMDKFMVAYCVSTEQMAIYTNAAKELPVTIIGASISAVLLPQLVKMIKRGQVKEGINLWKNATELSFIVLALIVAGIYTFADDAIRILYSEKYISGVPVFRIYTVVLMLRCTYFGIILNAYGESKKILECNFASLLVNAILNPILFYKIGIVGPAIATFISLLVVGGVQLAVTAKKTGFSLLDLFPWKESIIIVIINVMFSILFYYTRMKLNIDVYIGTIGESLILGIIWGAIYLFLYKNKIKKLWQILKTGE